MGIRIFDDYLVSGDPLAPPRGLPVRGALALDGPTGLTVARDGRVRAVHDCVDPRGTRDVALLRWMALVERGLIPLG